jgi:hypothetical protein
MHGGGRQGRPRRRSGHADLPHRPEGCEEKRV